MSHKGIKVWTDCGIKVY